MKEARRGQEQKEGQRKLKEGDYYDRVRGRNKRDTRESIVDKLGGWLKVE